MYPPIEITFLGTGTSSGVPMIGCDCEVCQSTNVKDKRLRSSILVQSPTTSVVIDTGPDFRSQMLMNRVKQLDAVLITHAHKDHIAGLDDIRAYNYFQQKPMDVYGNAATLQRLKMEFDYAFADEKYPGIPTINLHEVDEKEFMVGDMVVQPIKVWHLQMPVLGFRFGDFTYITDANRVDKASKEKIRGSKILVLNALRHEKHISHFTLDQAIKIAEELEVEHTYFTHISHQLGLHDVVSQQLPPNRQLAFDGLQVRL